MGKRRAKPTPKKLTEFLGALAETGNVTLSAEAVNLNRRELYRRRSEDADFAAAWDAAVEEAVDRLEAEARRRAVEGWEEPVYQQGARVGWVRKYSDTLLIFLLKGAAPEKYRDRVTNELTGPGGSPLPVAVNVYLPSNGRDVEGEGDGK